MARPGRKLLVASIGVAAVSYACHKTENGGGGGSGGGIRLPTGCGLGVAVGCGGAASPGS